MEVTALRTLVDAAGDDDPIAALGALARMRREIDRLEEVEVHRARVRGASWARVADALGVTRQAVHKRYGPDPARARRWRRS